MTVSELKQLLDKVPDDAQVTIAYSQHGESIAYFADIVEQAKNGDANYVILDAYSENIEQHRSKSVEQALDDGLAWQVM